jgi:CRP-like cAMP-binding protein
MGVVQVVPNPADDPRRGILREHLSARLPSCKPETISSLVDSAKLRSVRPGESIYAQGEPVPLTLILTGYGVAQRTTGDGQEFMSGVAPSGVLFGYSGIASTSSSIALLALTDCEVAQWPGAEFRQLIATDMALGFVAIDSMAASLHDAMARIEGFLHQDARRRVLRVLARYRDLFFGEPAVLTRAQLPGLVGTSREMTRRVLRQLEAEGTVRRVGRHGIQLLRPERLEAEGQAW